MLLSMKMNEIDQPHTRRVYNDEPYMRLKQQLSLTEFKIVTSYPVALKAFIFENLLYS